MVCTDATEKMWKNVQILERRLGGSRPLVPPPVSRPRSAPCLLIVSDYRFNTAKVDTTPQKEHSLALNLTLMIAIFIMMSFWDRTSPSFKSYREKPENERFECEFTHVNLLCPLFDSGSNSHRDCCAWKDRLTTSLNVHPSTKSDTRHF